ncbi:hypothetical protein JCM16418_730 [Paenibacillus pini JCM 16418]|uniref:TIGR04086 family membrane protein n=2 Tax=Paenibacillus TaxID=44249 RepID=W7YQ95_9BACL|nr:hypothetical protein JCM16418_730 [Paenibacillus pini JCM 16418]
MREQSLSHYTYVVHALSAFAGGLVSGKRSGKRGWYQGGMTGLIYGFLVIMIGFLALDSSIKTGDLILASLAFASGSIGGMIGVNSRNN